MPLRRAYEAARRAACRAPDAVARTPHEAERDTAGAAIAEEASRRARLVLARLVGSADGLRERLYLF